MKAAIERHTVKAKLPVLAHTVRPPFTQKDPYVVWIRVGLMQSSADGFHQFVFFLYANALGTSRYVIGIVLA